jgi:hypothetical protein
MAKIARHLAGCAPGGKQNLPTKAYKIGYFLLICPKP